MIKREKVGLAFTQQIGSSTRGTRFDFRLAVRTPGFYLRYGTGLQASSRHRLLALGDYYATQTK